MPRDSEHKRRSCLATRWDARPHTRTDRSALCRRPEDHRLHIVRTRGKSDPNLMIQATLANMRWRRARGRATLHTKLPTLRARSAHTLAGGATWRPNRPAAPAPTGARPGSGATRNKRDPAIPRRTWTSTCETTTPQGILPRWGVWASQLTTSTHWPPSNIDVLRRLFDRERLRLSGRCHRHRRLKPDIVRPLPLSGHPNVHLVPSCCNTRSLFRVAPPV